jgi:hypothetical protein
VAGYIFESFVKRDIFFKRYILEISVVEDNTGTQRVAGHTIRGKVEAHQGMTGATKAQQESDGPMHGPTT